MVSKELKFRLFNDYLYTMANHLHTRILLFCSCNAIYYRATCIIIAEFEFEIANPLKKNSNYQKLIR
jgi:hypothetical protein